MSLPEIRTGEPWIWPDGSPVRVAGPCAAVSAHQQHDAHLWAAPRRPGEYLQGIECSGYPVPPTWAEQEAQRVWRAHVDSALAAVR